LLLLKIIEWQLCTKKYTPAVRCVFFFLSDEGKPTSYALLANATDKIAVGAAAVGMVGGIVGEEE